MKTLIGLFILAIVVVSEAASCTPTSNQATKLQYILTDPTATLTLDDLGFTGNPLGAEFDPDKPKITFTKGATTVQLSGVSCAAGKGTYSMDSSNLVVWNSEDQWLGGAESGTPGYSWEGRDAGSPGFESLCVLNFDPPISELWFRYNTGQDVTTVANIYDKDDQLITCTVMESYPNGNTNMYREAGWRATSRQIKTLQFVGGYYAVDNIQIRNGCPSGQYWSGVACVGKFSIFFFRICRIDLKKTCFRF